MSYDHSLYADFVCLPGVTREQVVEAFAPVAAEHGWTAEDMLANALGSENDFSFKETEEGLNLSLYINGDVGDGFAFDLNKTALNLGPLIQPGYFTLSDYDTADLDNARTKYWAGKEPELLIAQRRQAITELAENYHSCFTADQLRTLLETVQNMEVEQASPIDRPRG